MSTFLGIPINTQQEIINNLGKLLKKFLATTIQSPPNGGIDESDFVLVGGVFKATVTLPIPFTGANSDEYNVILMSLTTGGCSFAPTIESRTTTTFVINLDTANKTGLVSMMYIAIKQD